MDIKSLYKVYKQHPCITTDSRDCPQGSIFLALKGANFDGNRFAAGALEKGCALAIVDDEAYAVEGDGRYILVDDALDTYQQLAREHRRRFQIPVVGITGTNGKTTTKELVSAILQTSYNVLYTEGNLNNDIGVPKTLFRLRRDHQVAVVEMGASHPGDIRRLVHTAEPTCALITNVGRAHLQGFGSIEGVEKTKGELYDFIAEQADHEWTWKEMNITDSYQTVVNADDATLCRMAKERGLLMPVSYSQDTADESANICGELISCDPFLKFRWRQNDEPEQWYEVQSHLVGAYNLNNMLAAIAVGDLLLVEPRDICRALESYVPSNSRSQLTVTEHNRLVVDAYNANPTSMMAALENFSLMGGEKKMLILGQMGELGSDSDAEHDKVAAYICQQGWRDVWLVGDSFAKSAERLSAQDAAAADTMRHWQLMATADEVKEAIARHRPEGYTILIKGSNSNKLYELPPLL